MMIAFIQPVNYDTSLEASIEANTNIENDTPPSALAKEGLSPGIMFLSVLGLVGAIAAGLWAFGDKDKNPDLVETQSEDPLAATNHAQLTTDTPPSTPNAPATSKATTETTQATPVTNKIANSVETSTKTALNQIDTATLAQSSTNTLPAAPETVANETNELQKSAKLAASELTQATREVRAATLESKDIISEQTDNLKQTTAKSEQATQDVPSENAITATNEATTEAISDVAPDFTETPVDPVAQTAELFASDPGKVQTPEDQLGADPIAAIQSLQQEATEKYADDENSATATQDIEKENIVKSPPENASIDHLASAPDQPANLPLESSPEESSSDSASAVPSKPSSIAPALSPALAATSGPTKPEEEDRSVEIQRAAEEVEEKFAGEIAALEDSFEQRTTRIANDLKAEQSRAKAQAEKIALLTEKLDAALIANEQRSNEEIAQLRQRIDELKAEDEQKSVSSERRTSGLLALISLQRTFDQGISYRRELDVLQSALPNQSAYRALNKTADEGAPTLETLKSGFPLAIRTTLAQQETGAKGPVGTIMRNLKSLVSVRPASPQEGTSMKAVISRAEDYLDRDNITDTIAEISSLGSSVSDEMSEWLQNATLHNDAAEELRTINESLLTGIGN